MTTIREKKIPRWRRRSLCLNRGPEQAALKRRDEKAGEDFREQFAKQAERANEERRNEIEDKEKATREQAKNVKGGGEGEQDRGRDHGGGAEG